jgi:hypothetical protein
MEKIKELLGQIGASEDLTNGLCEEFDRYSNSLKEKYEGILREKIDTVKKVCVEEVEREKVKLARKLGTFLESKAQTVEAAMKRQRVAEESEATSTLKKAKAILEDIQIDAGNSRERLALEKKSGRLEKAISALREERDRAVQKANKANEIAVKMLDKNRLYESKLVEAGLLTETKGGSSMCECGSPMGEGKTKCEKCDKATAEGKLPPEFIEQQKKAKEAKGGKDEKPEEKKGGKDEKPVEESKAPKRLDESRDKASKPKSTRRSLQETVARKDKVLNEDREISKIAEEMPDF